MKNALTVILAVFIFGALILIHELGHYIFARIFRVGIKEFSIGMGPKIFSKKSKKTGISYSLRLFPIGGYVAMIGEDGGCEEDGALCSKPKWQRAIVLAAGSAMNIVLGFILMISYVISAPAIGSTTVAGFSEGALSQQSGLMVDDEIISVAGHRVHLLYDLSYAISDYGQNPVDITVLRNGEKITLEKVSFPVTEEKGIRFGEQDFLVKRVEKNVKNILYCSYHQSVATLKMIYSSLGDLITGRYGLEAVSGPVGMTTAIGEVANTGVVNLLLFVAMITVNLGIFNLIPFPALDGGRILFLIIEAIRKKPVKPEIEGAINFAGLALLLFFSVFIAIKDVIGLL